MARTSYAAKKRTYQVLATALVEERRIGLITKEEFTKRHRELLADIFEEAE